MTIVDRARDTLRPTNSIEAILEPVRPPQGNAGPAAPEMSGAPPTSRTGRHEGQGKAAPYLSEPETISKRFYVEQKGNERQYFEDYKKTNLAMRATDTSISSKREDLNTVRAMLEIAEARGWHSVEIRGSADFKREAWIEASACGLEGRGFTPSDSDRQESDRRRAERGQANQVRSVDRKEARDERTVGHPAAVTTYEKKADAKQPGEPAAATLNDNKQTIREAQKGLSADGRMMLAALSEKIDRQMNKLNTEAKTEIKAMVGSELMKKERAEGPVVLSADQKRTVVAPVPVQAVTPTPAAPVRGQENEAPRRSIGR